LRDNLELSPDVSGYFIDNFMQALNSKTYIDNLQKHYENYFGISRQKLSWQLGQTEKLHKDFYIFYAIVGMQI
jgi:hypothetical protein